MLNRVTITGADDNTSIAEMCELSAEFPFVEWGILASQSREGSPRYPGIHWQRDLTDASFDDDNLHLSMHVCGVWARGLMSGDIKWGELPKLANHVGRMQVNGAGADFKFKLPSWLLGNLQLIFQSPSGSGATRGACMLGYSPAVLFDLSGGRGVPRDVWPDPIHGFYCGYAGGLSHENVAAQIEKIQEKCSRPFWIDTESGVRTDDRLDMNKVRRVIELCAPFVTESPDAR